MATYNSMSPQANKLLNPDGSITTMSGTLVSPANAEGVRLYNSMFPQANKMINPDGSITVIHSGEPVIITAADVVYTKNGQTNVEGALDTLFNGGGGGGGGGTVKSVNDISPDINGNILLTSENINTTIGVETKTQQEFNEEILDASLSFEIDV